MNNQYIFRDIVGAARQPLLAVLVLLAAGCAQYRPPTAEDFGREWTVLSGQWAVQDGVLAGYCPPYEGDARACAGRAVEAALLNRARLPANYRLATTLTLERGYAATLGLTGGTSRQVGLTFHAGRQRLIVKRHAATFWRAPASFPLAIGYGQPLRVEVEVCNGYVQVRSDGRRIGGGQLDELAGGGRLQLGVVGAAHFAGLTVQALPGSECARDTVPTNPAGIPREQLPADFEFAPSS
ncbi:hypothetical protein [Crenobacter caeni]|uniref:DUF1080 domain-containing protein n=1 Tax=Crenobacter caeni TaxID=2705474 RepID=A0A6B2KM92_9NEIS|nr:hypothetical protein [Crenobacter caeni]NDV11346.1 hypothetical protein [Crenobacter caeni]